MTTSECTRCHVSADRQIRLVHEGTGDEISLCLRCLRSDSRMKADRRDDTAHHLMLDYAEANAWEVYHSEHVRYMLPSMEPTQEDLPHPTRVVQV